MVHVVLVRCDGNLNLGAVARLCSNHGVESLRLVGGDADSTHRDTMMMAMHGQPVLQQALRMTSVAEATVDLDASFAFSAKVSVARDQPFTASYACQEVVGRVALVFGNEQDGLNQDERRACSHAVHLPTTGDSSLNLSHAVAAALALLNDGRPDPGIASQGQRQLLLSSWQRLLEGAGYYHRSSPDAFAPRLRALCDRMHLTADDVELLQSMMAVVSRGRDSHNRS
jgi:tRNA/rRNA methyltransferase